MSQNPLFALVGTPNSGKSSLFNAITGAQAKVANYAGVTVERRFGTSTTPQGQSFDILDLPGTYSLRARSIDEEITRDVVLGAHQSERQPDYIMAVADATNLNNSIRLVLELKETGRPVILILNMMDIARARGIEIDRAYIEEHLQIPVIETTAVRKAGMEEFWSSLNKILTKPVPRPAENRWSNPSAGNLRIAQRLADNIVKNAVHYPKAENSTSYSIDRVLLNPILGLVILFALLFLMFQAVFSWSTPFSDAIDAGFSWLAEFSANLLPQGLLLSFIQDALIAGVGGVLVFLPQILVLFFFILLLEETGYMARAAFLMDKLMGSAGLHGRAFIPLLSSFACAIPGIMSARVIDNQRDRLTTILIAPLMTCSARIPVYTLLISAFIPAQKFHGLQLQGLVMFGLYALGIISALIIARIITWLRRNQNINPPFLLELPDYKLPTFRNIFLGLKTRAQIFLRRAGTIIFYMSCILWILTTFPLPPEGATDPAINYSVASKLGHLMEPIFAPVGFNWQICVSLIPSMAAREVIVSSLGTVYSIGGSELALGAELAQQWSLATALALLAWFIFAPQCLATLAVIRRETGTAKWAWIAAGYLFALAYIAAFITYRIALGFGLG